MVLSWTPLLSFEVCSTHWSSHWNRQHEKEQYPRNDIVLTHRIKSWWKIYLLLSSNAPFERSMIAIHLLPAERTVDDLVKEEERGHHGECRGENSTHLAAINLLQLLWLGTPIFWSGQVHSPSPLPWNSLLKTHRRHKHNLHSIGQQATVLVTLLRCIVNCTAYPIQELCGPYPQKQGLGLKGLGWRFLTLTERALKKWRAIEGEYVKF